VHHALPELNPEDFWAPSEPNRVIFRALGTKHPRRLAEVYRKQLCEPGGRSEWRLKLESRVLALEIAASKLPRAEKVALLEEAAAHKLVAHRLAALRVLADLDPPAFRKHLRDRNATARMVWRELVRFLTLQELTRKP
jgi:hypothetical protein